MIIIVVGVLVAEKRPSNVSFIRHVCELRDREGRLDFVWRDAPGDCRGLRAHCFAFELLIGSHVSQVDIVLLLLCYVFIWTLQRKLGPTDHHILPILLLMLLRADCFIHEGYLSTTDHIWDFWLELHVAGVGVISSAAR